LFDAVKDVPFWCSVVVGDFTHIGTTALFRQLMTRDTEFSRLYAAQQRLGVTRQPGVRSAGVVIDSVLSGGADLDTDTVVIECNLANRVREMTFHEKAQRILGLVYLHHGEVAKAIKHLDKADPDPAVVEALLRCHVALGDLREVPALLEKADKFDKPADALRQTADRARRLIQRRSALAKDLKAPAGKESVFNTALNAYVCAEQIHAEGQLLRKVEALLAITFAADVDLGPAYGLRGRLLLDQGKLSRALADAERALALSPRDANGYYVRGRVRLERRLDGGLADLEKAAEFGARKDAEVLHHLADALFQAGRREEAVKTQREAIQLRPDDKELAEQLEAFEKAGEDKR